MGCIEPFVIDDDDGWCRQRCGRCGRPLTDGLWPDSARWRAARPGPVVIQRAGRASPQPVTLCKICSRRVLSTD